MDDKDIFLKHQGTWTLSNRVLALSTKSSMDRVLALSTKSSMDNKFLHVQYPSDTRYKANAFNGAFTRVY